MARGINKAIIVGNVGKDPEVRYSASGAAIANFSVATTESWKDKQTGQRQDKTEWHRMVAFNRTGEIAGQYLKKGSQVYIEGKIQTRKWEDQNGNERYTTEIVVNDLQMLGGRGEESNEQRPSQGGGQQRQPSGGAPSQSAPDDFSDDIPFITNIDTDCEYRRRRKV